MNRGSSDGHCGSRSEEWSHGPQHAIGADRTALEHNWSVRQIPPSASFFASSLSQSTLNKKNKNFHHPSTLADHMLSPQRGGPGLVLDAQASSGGNRFSKTGMIDPRPQGHSRHDGHSQSTHPQHVASQTNRFSRLIRQSLPNSIISSSMPAPNGNEERLVPHTDTVPTSPTAAKFARDAPAAGFLYKFGTQVPEFKRRFFVLQPATHLYYFLSPHDSQPRGCLDLQDSWIEEDFGETDSEFAVCWPSTSDGDRAAVNAHRGSIRRVILRAKSPEEAQAWIESLRTQRLDVVQSELATSMNQTAGYKARLKELNATLERYKLIEIDRDGAVLDAQKYQKNNQLLDQGILRLAQMLQRKIRCFKEGSTPNAATSDQEYSPVAAHVAASQTSPLDMEQRSEQTDPTDVLNPTESVNGENGVVGTAENRGSEKDFHHATEEDCAINNSSDDQMKILDGNALPGTKSDIAKRPSSLDSDQDNSMTQDQLNQIPGENFGTLFNACLSLETHWKLAVQESSTAVQDLTAAQANMQQLQKRLSKAEQQLLKLWEENCDIRRQLKQRKKEKRVLVQEVKNLQQQLSNQQESSIKSESVPMVAVADDTFEGGEVDMEEEKLLNELEEHVSTSIQLHEQMLRGKSPQKTPQFAVKTPSKSDGPIHKNSSRGNMEAKSLFDDFEDESDDENDENSMNHSVVGLNKEDSEHGTSDTELDTVSSIQAEMGDADESVREGKCTLELGSSSYEARIGDAVLTSPAIMKTTDDVPPDDMSCNNAPYQANPLLELQNSNSPVLHDTIKPSPQRPLITNSGYATSALECPLVDVMGSPLINHRFDGSNIREELQVYHLTFYSRKIGIQFQKVPPPPAQSRGLLTEAMTADLAGVRVAGEKTAAELRRIATLSTWAKTDKSHATKGDTLEVAVPVHAVLVCGFVGFDDSGTNTRPKLGARLVAFDGVSVEIGMWTFESIRKAIQMRGRPLTLSFRNDFLTTEQRQILTKATREVEQDIPGPNRPLIQYRDGSTQPSVSTVSIGSHENDQLEDESVRSAPSIRSVHFANNTGEDESVPFNSPGATARNYGSYQPRSFSEAGSSTASSVLSAVGPLVSNLLSHKYNAVNTPFTPEYMRRPNRSVEDTPQHQDFEAGLL